MPPQAKFSREEIVETALRIVQKDGIEALTSRALGLELGSSPRPIFTVYQNMKEVQEDVSKAAKARYQTYIEKGLSETVPFKGTGKQYILFSIEEPKLFQLLFMSEHKQVPSLSTILPLIDHSYEAILASIISSYGLNRASAQRLYHHLWIYSHGIATLCATKMCRFTEDEISTMITEVCMSLLKNKKAWETI